MKRYTFFLFLLCGLAGCGKKDQRPKIDFGPNGGITETDVSNQQTGKIDPSDWTLDVTWNAQELALFEELGLDLNGATGTAFDRRTLRTLYPNPVGAGMVQFGFAKPPGMAAQLVIVDQYYQVIDRFRLSDAMGAYGLSLQLPADKYTAGHTYRLYYVFYSPLTGTTLQAKGHGDFRMAK